MATTFQQTDTAAAAGALIAACSSNSNNTDKESNQAEDGGTAGSTERTVTLDGNAADLNGVWMEIINIDAYDGATGDWTWRLNITTGNHQITLDEVWICHVDSGYSAKATVGGTTGIGSNLASTGTYSGTINQASSLSIASGDKILVIFAFDNGNAMTQDIGYTPSLTISAPGTIDTGQTVTPTAVAATFAVATPSLDWVLNPAAVAASFVVPDAIPALDYGPSQQLRPPVVAIRRT